MWNFLRYQQTNKNITCGIFLDLKKAFDTVNHSILKQKLIYNGKRGIPLNLLSSYLSNRYQKCINSTNCDKFVIKYGVPQGSVLGPILFLLYVNDLPKALNLKTLFFADDTVLFVSRDNYTSLKKFVNIEQKKI